MAITVRLLQPDEASLANDFFNQTYKTDRPIENFRWEFLNGPFGKAIYVVAVDESIGPKKIVGIQCAIPIELLSSKGDTVLTAKSEDTLVDPSYRGQKIFERMYDLLFKECKAAGIKYIWGFTPAQKAFERIGFQIPFKTEQALMVFNPITAYQHLKNLNPENKLKEKFQILGLCLLSCLSALKIVFSKKAPLEETSLEFLNNHFLAFYKGQRYVSLNENMSYISWRIDNNPFHNTYKCFQWNAGNEVMASAIINIREKVSYLEQVYIKPGIQPKPFLAAVIYLLKKQNGSLVRAFCFSSNDELREQGKALSQAGFTYLKRGNYFVWKSLNSENLISPEHLLINRLFTQGNN